MRTQIERVYIELLKLPPQNNFRALNQDIYGRVRDFIAEGRKQEPEFVQTYFEQIVVTNKN